MHSRIFFTSFKKDESPEILTEEELMKEMPGSADYVDSNTDLEDDVKWLGFKFKKFKDCYEVDIGKEGIKSFREWHLGQVKLAYKEFLKKSDAIHSWMLSDRAYTDTGFLFFNKEAGELMNEIEFVDWLENNKIDKFYVFRTFDYHF